MIARNRLAAFLKHAKQTPTLPYTWEHEGNEASARVFVHRMRVELSDMRHTLKLMNRPIRPFKVLLNNLVAISDNVTSITLSYRPADAIVMTEELNKLADMIAYDTRPTQRPVALGGFSVKTS